MSEETFIVTGIDEPISIKQIDSDSKRKMNNQILNIINEGLWNSTIIDSNDYGKQVIGAGHRDRR